MRCAAGRYALTCLAVTALSCARTSPRALAAAPVADLSVADLADAPRAVPPTRPVDPFAPGLGVSLGVASYPSPGTQQIGDRSALGAYVHFLEDEGRRWEASVAFVPSSLDPAESYYWSLGVRYVGYLGREGYASWGVGGGTLVESWYGLHGSATYVGLSLGWWVPTGPGGIDVRLEVQSLIGEDPGAPVIVLLSMGYDL